MIAEIDEFDSLILRKAVRDVLRKLQEIATETDPAPWYDVPACEVEFWAEGDDNGFIRRKKLEKRAIYTLQFALLTGDLVAQFKDGKDTAVVPAWALHGAELHSSIWFDSRLPIEPFLPDEWYRWSCHDVFIDRAALNDWLTRADLAAFRSPPSLPAPFDGVQKPQPMTKRTPRDVTFVTLSEALSWVAFGISIDKDRLHLALGGLGIDATASQTAVRAAVEKLADLGTGSKIAMRGKYISRYDDDELKIQTQAIDPIKLADFAQFDVLHEGLKFGNGLTWLDHENSIERIFSPREDAFRSVTVSRSDLMAQFPDRYNVMTAMVVPLAASLPDIGPVLGIAEALNLLAFGKASFDIGVWRSSNGDLTFTEPLGAIIAPYPDGKFPTIYTELTSANAKLHGALQSAVLASFVFPTGGIPLAVPRLYWNGVNPEQLTLVFDGISQSDPGIGCPLLLSRLAFDSWRNGGGTIAAVSRAPAVKKGRPPSDSEILAKADEMKARGLSGREIAKTMRDTAGFEDVATTLVRELIKGRWERGRPKERA